MFLVLELVVSDDINSIEDEETMKEQGLESRLKKLALRFGTVKKYKPVTLLDDILETVAPVGGLTGLKVHSYGTLTLCTGVGNYKLPIQYEEYRDGGLSSFGKRAYEFLEALSDYLVDTGISKRDIEFHLGKSYSSKHHDPRK